MWKGILFKDAGEWKTVEMLKRVWDRKYINSLKDSAFAWIWKDKVTGKDEEGRSIPRSARYFPHHNKSVRTGMEKDTVDLPHLRNALARLSQAKIPDSGKKAAEQHLRMHAKQLGVGEDDGKSLDKMLVNEISDVIEQLIERCQLSIVTKEDEDETDDE